MIHKSYIYIPPLSKLETLISNFAASPPSENSKYHSQVLKSSSSS
ncbi:unnamed protein product [Arabidopsis thaliana]|uniref:(thale cress) hypothetical protein n=1 Tax=Arabidopsis thaliana TaxID=3702 RepID=A0A7G2EXK5_ARATH|nr:unnamed protein product [Arabidopsis thaliana]